MSFIQEQKTFLKLISNENIKKVDNFKYFEAWIDNMENDVKVRKTLMWKSWNKLNKISQISLSKFFKLRTSRALVESAYLYESEF